MDTRNFVVGAAVGAIITAIAFVGFRSDSTSTVAAKSDTAMNREAPTSPADDSPPREPAKAAHPAAADSGIPPAPQPAGSLSQTVLLGSSQILMLQKVRETKKSVKAAKKASASQLSD
jgi:hypothetical protein